MDGLEDLFVIDKGGCSDSELRSALGLGSRDLPVHVYRMRSLGYPPGWLRKARVGDELSMIDSVEDFSETSKVEYKIEELIAYPGFNVDPDYNVEDNCAALNCPPLQERHRIAVFHSALSGSCGTQALTDLHDRRMKILQEMRSLTSQIQTVPVPPPEASGSPAAETQTDNSEVSPPSQSTEANGHSSSSQSLVVCNSQDGTPMPVSTPSSGPDGCPTPSKARPSFEAFAVGVQPYRPFENLPGTQGTYKRVQQGLREACEAVVESDGTADPPNVSSVPGRPLLTAPPTNRSSRLHTTSAAESTNHGRRTSADQHHHHHHSRSPPPANHSRSPLLGRDRRPAASAHNTEAYSSRSRNDAAAYRNRSPLLAPPSSRYPQPEPRFEPSTGRPQFNDRLAYPSAGFQNEAYSSAYTSGPSQRSGDRHRPAPAPPSSSAYNDRHSRQGYHYEPPRRWY